MKKLLPILFFPILANAAPIPTADVSDTGQAVVTIPVIDVNGQKSKAKLVLYPNQTYSYNLEPLHCEPAQYGTCRFDELKQYEDFNDY